MEKYRETAEARRSRLKYATSLTTWLVKKYRMTWLTRLLDVGCGEGWYINEFHTHGVAASGVDKSKGRFIVACDIEKKIKARDGYYDYVLCKSVLEHVHDPEKLIADMAKKLNYVGTLITITPDWRYCWRGFYAYIGHVRPLCASAIEQCMERAGLVDVKTEMLRPSRLVLEHPKWRWLIVALAAILPDKIAGQFQFAKNKYLMAIVTGRKPDG